MSAAPMREQVSKHWRTQLSECLDGLEERIDQHVESQIDERYAAYVAEMGLTPDYEQIGIWLWHEERMRIFDLESVIVDWLAPSDPEGSEATREQLENWANALNRMSERLRAQANRLPQHQVQP